MSRELRDDMLQLFKLGMVSPDGVMHLIHRMSNWQRKAILAFSEKGDGRLKLTEAQIFTTSRFGFGKSYPDELIQMDELINDGFVEKFVGGSVGHNRYRLTNQGLITLYHLRGETPVSADTSVDWTKAKDVETMVRLLGPPREGREMPPDSVLEEFNPFNHEDVGDEDPEFFEHWSDVYTRDM